MDLFDSRHAKPMLIGTSGPAFDDPAYIHELKWDGIRCIAYLGDGKTELRNKKLIDVTGKYPELSMIHEQVSGRVILDGEIFVMKDGGPSFSDVQRRSIMTNQLKISVAAQSLPVTLVAFDILYMDGVQLTDRPLMERKEFLQRCVVNESERLVVSRIIDTFGIALFELTKERGLEGIVSKRKDSLYRMDKRTTDWIKCKNLLDDDFAICGYVEAKGAMASIIIGQFSGDTIIYKGSVTLGMSREEWRMIRTLPRRQSPPFDVQPIGFEAVWVEPSLTCTVQYMELTASGGLRQPIFKRLIEM